MTLGVVPGEQRTSTLACCWCSVAVVVLSGVESGTVLPAARGAFYAELCWGTLHAASAKIASRASCWYMGRSISLGVASGPTRPCEGR